VILRSIDWYLVTDVFGQPVCLIFSGQAVHKKKCECIMVTKFAVSWLLTLMHELQLEDHPLSLTAVASS